MLNGGILVKVETAPGYCIVWFFYTAVYYFGLWFSSFNFPGSNDYLFSYYISRSTLYFVKSTAVIDCCCFQE